MTNTDFPSQTPVFTADYESRVYAALLGKAIGVYLGRPIEGWSSRRVLDTTGPVDRYVSEELGKRLIVTDDDIAGTVTFIRAVEDSGRGYDTTSQDVADAWLNYLIEHRSVLWWGGMGNSTEHTAYLRLKQGHRPPVSGSSELNGQVVSEQIGAQIFVEGWALIAPGAPGLAAELARRAAVVSHDGEAVYGAQALAAMQSAAFVETDVQTLLDVALSVIPADSLIATMIGDIRSWHAEGIDWMAARDRLDESYGYEIYGGNCHMIPNHGLIVLALLYGEGDFSRSLMIVNTGGWDTDCNSGNIGALLGLMVGIEGIDAGTYDWRSPIADRIFAPTADAGSGITDVLREARRVAALGREAAGQTPSRSRARFDFGEPGAVQGFEIIEGAGRLRNTAAKEGRGLTVLGADGPVALLTPTFVLPDEWDMPGYDLDASPTLYPGQEVSFMIDSAVAGFATPVLQHYASDRRLRTLSGETTALSEGSAVIRWTVPDLGGEPVVRIGLRLSGPEAGAPEGITLTGVDWSGAPRTSFRKPEAGSPYWHRSWVSVLDYDHDNPPESFRLVSNGERRMLMTGTREWQNYRVTALLTPHAGDAMGVAVRVQGLERYYLVEADRAGAVRIIRREHGDTLLAETPFSWADGETVELGAEAHGATIRALVNGTVVAEVEDASYDCGGIALTATTARVACDRVDVVPLI